MKHTIVPELLKSKEAKFLNESSIEIDFPSSPFLYIEPYTQPFLIIDTFAKKTKKTENIVGIYDISELKNLGFNIISLKVKEKWFKGQVVMYKLDSVKNQTPYAKKLKSIPLGHKIERDKANNKIRLVGPNAGFPHYLAEGGSGPWIDLQEEKI